MLYDGLCADVTEYSSIRCTLFCWRGKKTATCENVILAEGEREKGWINGWRKKWKTGQRRLDAGSREVLFCTRKERDDEKIERQMG